MTEKNKISPKIALITKINSEKKNILFLQKKRKNIVAKDKTSKIIKIEKKLFMFTRKDRKAKKKPIFLTKIFTLRAPTAGLFEELSLPSAFAGPESGGFRTQS